MAKCLRSVYSDRDAIGLWLTTGDGPPPMKDEHFNCIVERTGQGPACCGHEARFFSPISAASENLNHNPAPETVFL